MAKKSRSKVESLANDSINGGKGNAYIVDPKVIEAGGRDSSVLVGSRLCDSCQTEIDPFQFAPKVRFAELVKVVRSHCSHTPQYLDPSLPTLEIAFRLLLVKGNRSTSLVGIHDQLSAILMNAVWPRYISEQDLERMLSQDTYYGIVHHLV